MPSERACPSCSHPGNRGSYCTECGAPLAAAACARCGGQLDEAAAFCPACGRAASASTRRGRALAVAGGVILALTIGWIGGSLGGGMEPAPTLFTDAPAPAAEATPDIGAMSPRERADRLFDRVMRAVSAGDSSEARQFVPMALAAHEQIGTLDQDLRFHVAVLSLIDGRPAEAATQAEAILDDDPDHLFGLHTAAQAALELGDRTAARRYYERLLAVYPREAVRRLPEYEMHAPLIPHMRRDAEAYLESGR